MKPAKVIVFGDAHGQTTYRFETQHAAREPLASSVFDICMC